MIALLLAAGLSTYGHHPLPNRPEPAECRRSEAQLRSVLVHGSRPRRLRALALLRRCQLPLPLDALMVDRDPELRLAAWSVALRRRPNDAQLWLSAERALKPKRFRVLLRAKPAWREAEDSEGR